MNSPKIGFYLKKKSALIILIVKFKYTMKKMIVAFHDI